MQGANKLHIMPTGSSTRLRASDITVAIALLTRLPVSADHRRGARAAWAWPVAGAVIALISVVVGQIVYALGLPATLAGLVVVACSIVLTGGMHEDGLADCADGFWGGFDPQRRLNIMKDSAIGTYGTLALALVVIGKWISIVMLIQADSLAGAFVAAAALSRGAMVWVMHHLEPARRHGLSHSVGRPDKSTVLMTAACALVLSLLATAFWTIPALIAAIVLTLAVAAIARAKIAGQTGDVLGATQQITELGILMVLAAGLAAG